MTRWVAGPSAADLASAPELEAAFVPRPEGGSDGQVLTKSGADVVWAAAGSGSGLTLVNY